MARKSAIVMTQNQIQMQTKKVNKTVSIETLKKWRCVHSQRHQQPTIYSTMLSIHEKKEEKANNLQCANFKLYAQTEN